MKDSRTQTQKLLHAFFTCTVVMVSGILIAMGACAAKNNTDALDRGIRPAMIYAARQDQQISVTVDQAVFTTRSAPPLPAETVLSLMPAPWGNLYLIGTTLGELLPAR